MAIDTKEKESAIFVESARQGRNNSVPEIQEELGIRIDAASIDGDRLKLDHDGRLILIPQPSDNPEDPLNWTAYKKNLVLAVLVACSFLPDYGSVTGAATLTLQAE